ncbi:MAG: type II toxin-antitoxin system RelE/ParE family toxin [Solirubrobacterales bacterium]
MEPSAAYEVRLTKAAAKQFRELGSPDGERVRESLLRPASQIASRAGVRGGKSLKQIRGRRDRFYRLRIGDLRIMFDLLGEERVLLVLGIVQRRDLERRLRSR